MKQEHEERFKEIFAEVNRDEKLERMREFIQHGTVSTYDQVIRVAHMSMAMAKKLHLRVHEHDLVRGALLHDYFLYDWHHWDGPLHGPYHPKHALENALRDFDLSKRERNIIRSHMWPLTLFHFPRNREALITCIADKVVSTKETVKGFQEKVRMRKEKKHKQKEEGSNRYYELHRPHEG